MSNANGEILRREARLLWEQALQYQSEGNLSKAIEHYRLSLELVPTAEAHTYLGWAFSLVGNFDLARKQCLMAIDLDPDFGNPYNDIGVYLIHDFKFDAAIDWFEQAISAKRYDWPHFPMYNLGTIWEFKGLWRRALRYYEQSLKFEPKYIHAIKAQKRVSGLMRPKQGLRAFTLAEANNTLPYVSQIMGDIYLVWSELIPQHARYFEALELKDITGKVPADGLKEHVQILENLNLKLRVYIKELHNLGIQVASPSTGTVNYLAYIDGQQAMYSWRLGDGKICFWHLLDADSNDRRQLKTK